MNDLCKLTFPQIQIFKEILAGEITDVQPMIAPVRRKKHWEIIPMDDKWILKSWWTYSIFTLARPKETPEYHTETIVFDNQEEAQQTLLLEKFEQ